MALKSAYNKCRLCIICYCYCCIFCYSLTIASERIAQYHKWVHKMYIADWKRKKKRRHGKREKYVENKRNGIENIHWKRKQKYWISFENGSVLINSVQPSLLHCLFHSFTLPLYLSVPYALLRDFIRLINFITY